MRVSSKLKSIQQSKEIRFAVSPFTIFQKGESPLRSDGRRVISNLKATYEHEKITNRYFRPKACFSLVIRKTFWLFLVMTLCVPLHPALKNRVQNGFWSLKCQTNSANLIKQFVSVLNYMRIKQTISVWSVQNMFPKPKDQTNPQESTKQFLISVASPWTRITWGGWRYFLNVSCFVIFGDVVNAIRL